MNKIRNNKFLKKLNRKVHRRLGDNIYLIMLIMGVMLVFSGLIVGLLGRGWAWAWFLVAFGILLGFFPVVGYLMRDRESVKEEPEGPKAFTDEVESPMQRKKRQEREQENKKAIEFEALLAKQRIRRQEEERLKMEELKRREEQILKEAREQERKKIQDEEKKKRDKEKAEQKRREEQGAKWKKSGNNVYRGGKKSGRQKKSEYFDGVSTLSDLKKRYKDLVKIHHPDNGGDADTLHAIQKEYNELERFFISFERHKNNKKKK